MTFGTLLTAMITPFDARGALDVDESARLGDAGTADFLTGLLEEHEKMAWMLRSFIS